MISWWFQYKDIISLGIIIIFFLFICYIIQVTNAHNTHFNCGANVTYLKDLQKEEIFSGYRPLTIFRPPSKLVCKWTKVTVINYNAESCDCFVTVDAMLPDAGNPKVRKIFITNYGNVRNTGHMLVKILINLCSCSLMLQGVQPGRMYRYNFKISWKSWNSLTNASIWSCL